MRFVYSGGLRDLTYAVTSRNTWGMGLPGGGGALLARSIGTGTGHQNYHYDGRGNVAAITDSNQILRAFYAWDAYGSKNTAATSAQYTQQSQPYQFSTKWRHRHTSVYFDEVRIGNSREEVALPQEAPQ